MSYQNITDSLQTGKSDHKLMADAVAKLIESRLHEPNRLALG